MADYAKIKRNIQRMIDQGAPGPDIDGYVASEGVTAEELRAAPKLSAEPVVAAPGPDGQQMSVSQFDQMAEATKAKDHGGYLSTIWRDFVEPWVPNSLPDFSERGIAERAGDAMGFVASVPVRLATQGEYGAADLAKGLGAENLGIVLEKGERDFALNNARQLQTVKNAGDLAMGLPGAAAMPTVAAAGKKLPAVDEAVIRARVAGEEAPGNLSTWLSGKAASEAPEAAGVAPKAATVAKVADDVPEGAVKVITPDQSMEVVAKPTLVELADLKLAQGKFQPRDRTRAEYVQEVRERATKLDPEQLKPGRVSDSGAPIVLEDGTILSGNGRAMSIAEVYRDPALRTQADAYRASLGPEAAKMQQPVLVMRTGKLADDEAARFADRSNRSRIQEMSATERATRDAAALDPDTLALYQGGDFDAAVNAPFLRTFQDKVVAATERGSSGKNAELTQDGARRMRNAVLAAAYRDPAVLSRMLESTDDNVRSLTTAMVEAAPAMAKLKAGLDAGEVLPGLDPMKGLTGALKLIGDLRARHISTASHLDQIDAFGGDMGVQQWVRALYKDDLSGPLGKAAIERLLKAYADEAGKHRPGGLFDDPTTASDVLKVARSKAMATEADEAALAATLGKTEAPAAKTQAPTATAKPPMSKEEAAAIATRELGNARRTDIAKALGAADPASMTAPRIIDRLFEMAQKAEPDAVQGLLDAKRLIGEDVWRKVSSRLLDRLGVAEGGVNKEAFAALKALTPNAKTIIFGNDLAKALDDLARSIDASPKPPAVNQVAAAAQRLGVSIPRVAATGDGIAGITARQTAGALSAIPLVGAPLRKAAGSAINQMKGAAKKIADGYAPAASVQSAGDAAKSSIAQWITTGSDDVMRRLYDDVGAVLPKNKLGPMAKTRETVKRLTAEDTAAATGVNEFAIGKVAAALERPDGLTFEGMQRLRTTIGALIEDSFLKEGGTVKPALKRVYGALSEDLDSMVRQSGGEKAVKAWDKANRVAKLIEEKRETLTKVIGKSDTERSSENVLDRIVQMAGSRSTADVQKLLAARKAIGESWDEVAAVAIERLGRGAENDFNLARFLTNYRALSENGRNILFATTGKAHLKAALDDLATLAEKFKALEKMGNPSGTGGVNSLLSGFGGAGVVTGVVSMSHILTSVVPMFVMAKFMARPAKVRAFNRWGGIYLRFAKGEIGTATMRFATLSLAKVIADDTGEDERMVAARIEQAMAGGAQ